MVQETAALGRNAWGWEFSCGKTTMGMQGKKRVKMGLTCFPPRHHETNVGRTRIIMLEHI